MSGGFSAEELAGIRESFDQVSDRKILLLYKFVARQGSEGKFVGYIATTSVHRAKVVNKCLVISHASYL